MEGIRCMGGSMPASGGMNGAGGIKCGGGNSESKGMPGGGGPPRPSSIPGGGGGIGGESRGGCSISVKSSLLVTPRPRTGPGIKEKKKSG